MAPLARWPEGPGLSADSGGTFSATGIPLKAIQELMGRSDLQTTERCAQLAPNVKNDAVALLARPLSIGCRRHMGWHRE